MRERAEEGRTGGGLPFLGGSSTARAIHGSTGVNSKLRVHREVGMGKGVWSSENMHMSTDSTHLKAPDLPQTLLYLTPPSARSLGLPCNCAMKVPCRCERTRSEEAHV